MTLSRSLTPEQLAAVHHRGSALLTACPGSGKTRTVAAKLIHEHEIRRIGSKRWLLAITHTNVAAEEILERLDNSGVDAKYVWVGTVHSFCLEWVLKPYAGLEPRISRGYRIINEFEQRDATSRIKRKHGMSDWDELPAKLDSNLQIAASHKGSLRNAIAEYHEFLSQEKLIDFDLILTLATRLLERFDFIGARLGLLFDLMIVDEYQDLSQQQYDIVSSITRHGRTRALFVGDVDQAIYTTLGAVVKGKAELETQLGIRDMAELSLSGCFRSAQRIVDFYRNFQDHPIDIVSRLDPTTREVDISYDADIPVENLAAYVAELVSFHLDAGVAADEIVVLAPQWPDASGLGRKLQELLPATRVDSPNSSPLPLTLENRWQSLIRLRSTPSVPENYSRRQRIADSVGGDLRHMGFDTQGHDRLRKLILSTINQLGQPDREPIGDYIRRTIEEFSERMNLRLGNNPIALDELTALQFAVANRVERLGLTDDATLLARSFSRQPGVKVTSYHSTKGEEYDVVIATGLVKGKVPHWNDVIDREAVHTDFVTRRLLYVACSRARYSLHLVSEVGHRTRKGGLLTPTPQLFPFARHLD